MRDLQFFKRIMQLRMAAASLYDRGLSKGVSQEEIQETIAPLTKKLSEEIREAAKINLPGVALAVWNLEAQVESYKTTIKALLQKVVDDEHHVNLLKSAVLERMRSDGIREDLQDGFSAIVTGDPGQESITFR